MSSATQDEMFRPPVDRAMRVLNRSFFQKKVTLAAAKVFETNQITVCRNALGGDVLKAGSITSVRPLLDARGEQTSSKGVLLDPAIRPDDSATWSDRLRALVDENRVAVTSYDLKLEYDYWPYLDIMTAILPEDAQDEIPTGFSVVGHVAHLNLRSQYLPYKHLIAEVIMDKNPVVRTVINKVDTVGEQSEFRTFSYELLAGDPSLDVEIKEQQCLFRFNYAQVYWNSRLNTEHERLVNMFSPGEAVCDVMAGVGPFAVPAGKKGVFVWANDLNPASYHSMKDAIERNKVGEFVKAYNMDGREFIRNTAKEIQLENRSIDITPKPKRVSRSAPPRPVSPKRRKYITQPKTFDHYVMNLPATAVTFLDAFIGLYRGQEDLFTPQTRRKLPMIHVHCFDAKLEEDELVEKRICEDISAKIGHEITRETPEISLWDVRDVAPKKRMFCMLILQ